MYSSVGSPSRAPEPAYKSTRADPEFAPVVGKRVRRRSPTAGSTNCGCQGFSVGRYFHDHARRLAPRGPHLGLATLVVGGLEPAPLIVALGAIPSPTGVGTRTADACLPFAETGERDTHPAAQPFSMTSGCRHGGMMIPTCGTSMHSCWTPSLTLRASLSMQFFCDFLTIPGVVPSMNRRLSTRSNRRARLASGQRPLTIRTPAGLSPVLPSPRCPPSRICRVPGGLPGAANGWHSRASRSARG